MVDLKKGDTPVKTKELVPTAGGQEAPMKRVTLDHITPGAVVKVQAALRSAGINIDTKSTAIVYEVIIAYIVRKGAITLDELTGIVATVSQIPEFAQPQTK